MLCYEIVPVNYTKQLYLNEHLLNQFHFAANEHS